jgi:tetratricopeptide (TPR) repeat protein
MAGLLSACSLDPNVRKQKYFQDGQGFFGKGDYHAAAIEFTKAIKVDPGYAEAHLQLAESYMLSHQSDHAYQEFTRTIELRPDDYRARIGMANLLVLSQNFTQAKEQTDVLLKLRPNDPAVHSAISSVLAGQGDIPGAIRETQQTIALAPGHWEPYLSLALLQVKDNQFDAAEASFKKVIEMDPKETEARVLLGDYYRSRNRLADAEQQFRAAISVAPTDMAPREALAKFYLAQAKTKDAENVLEQAKRDLPHNAEAFLALSNFYFVTGNLDRAVAEYAALYQEHLKDTTIKKKYIQLLIQTKHYDEANKIDAEILKATPNDSDALIYRSQVQISEGNVNDAAQTLQIVVKNSPNDSQAHYALGVALNKQGYPERAESEWREALRLNPNFLDAQRAIADKAMLNGDMNELQDAANQMIRLEPDSAEGYALRALTNINRSQFDAAERDVRRSIAVAPQSAFGYVQMGNLRYAQKQYSDAAKAYQDALDRNIGSTDALRGLMNTYVAEKQPEKAIAVAKAQIVKAPDSSSFYDLLGAALFHFAKDLNGAEAALQKSVQLDGHNADAVIQLCQVQAMNGQVDQAIATGEQSLKQNSRQPGLYILLGDLHVAKSDWKAAENAYQSALAIDSLNGVASNDLANVMLHTGGSLDVALSLAQTARREMPASPAAADTMGWIYYQKGDYQMALNSLQQALNLVQKSQMMDNPDIHYHLGMVYGKTQQPALARQQLEQVLKTNPNYSNVSEIKAELARLKS